VDEREGSKQGFGKEKGTVRKEGNSMSTVTEGKADVGIRSGAHPMNYQ